MADQYLDPHGDDGWAVAHEALIQFLDGVGAVEGAHTVTVVPLPKKIDSAEQFADWLEPQVLADGEWLFLTGRGESGELLGFAMPAADGSARDVLALPFVGIHTMMVAWWLTTAWRVRQLAKAALTLATAGEAVAAAACVRPLVETAAAFWVDGRKLVTAWDEIKRAGDPAKSGQECGKMSQLRKVLVEVSWGAKFDNRVPELKEVWGHYERSNVLGQLDKLAKVAGSQIQEDYQWLCNTVHPSLGNTFAFCAPPQMHSTGTHVITWFCGRPIHITGGGETVAERTVQRATARGAARALAVLQLSLDAALRTLDDMALTTRVPVIVREQYWRNLRPSRHGLCPCRSGLEARRCRHAWGEGAPPFPSTFT